MCYHSSVLPVCCGCLVYLLLVLRVDNSLLVVALLWLAAAARQEVMLAADIALNDWLVWLKIGFWADFLGLRAILNYRVKNIKVTLNTIIILYSCSCTANKQHHLNLWRTLRLQKC